MDRVFLDLGFIKIYWYSIMILTGAIIGLVLSYREFKKQGIEVKKLDNMVFFTIIIGIIGARLWYVVFNLDYYTKHLSEIFAIWNGGLAIHGGVIFGIGFLYFYCRKHNMSFYKIVDICIPALLFGQIIGRWGNFFNQEAHGGIVSLAFLKNLHLPSFIIKGMFIEGNYYHPTFLYESVFNLLILIFILIIRRNKKIHEGTVLSIYMIGYGILRFFIESLRTDSLMLGNIRIAQLISVLLYIGGIVLLFYSITKKKYYNFNEQEYYEKNIKITKYCKLSKKKVK